MNAPPEVGKQAIWGIREIASRYATPKFLAFAVSRWMV
jgi:hypothetical protein